MNDGSQNEIVSKVFLTSVVDESRRSTCLNENNMKFGGVKLTGMSGF